ncbi:hypothetical protein CFC21_107072 [Triticum aestivum]|uniref:Pectinesterase inhibitor domain-containing protein n=3 Tax=Triticinae TaxID=1648030 RepID=A0A9R1NA81_WHEAT|nr:hypothetical protein CFC21_107072 [Triticum aestivum]
MASFSSSSTSVIIVLLLLLPVLLAPPASAIPVLAACKTVGGGSTYFDVTFCLEALGSSGVKIKVGDTALVRPLRSCQSLYGGIVHGGPACTAAVKGGKFGDAAAILEKAAAAAKECEGGFRKSKAAPLTAEDDDTFKLAKLGVALLGLA